MAKTPRSRFSAVPIGAGGRRHSLDTLFNSVPFVGGGGLISGGAATTSKIAGSVGGSYPAPPDPTGISYIWDANAANDNGDGSSALPFKTITPARLRLLSQGRNGYFKTGRYEGVQCVTGLASGNASTRIYLANYPGHTPTWGGHSSATNLNVQYAIGGCGFWDMDGWVIDATNWGVLIGPRQWSGTEAPVNNFRVIRCTGAKTNNGSAFHDNSGIVFFDYGNDYIEVVLCSFTGTGWNGVTNNSLVWADRIPHFKLLGTLMDNCCHPFYYKHTHFETNEANTNIQIDGNIFSRGLRGVYLCLQFPHLFNNAFRSCPLNLSDDGGDYGDTTVRFRRGSMLANTFLDSNVELYENGYVSHNGWFLRENLFLGSSTLRDNPSGQTSNRDFNTDTDYNAYTGGSAVTRNGNTRSLADHKLAFLDQEQHSVAGSNVISASGSALLAAYYQLLSGPALTGGRGGVACGADYTKLLAVA
jgi:hypothetical protein